MYTWFCKHFVCVSCKEIGGVKREEEKEEEEEDLYICEWKEKEKKQGGREEI